jgi:uncharacterized membrane protein
MQIFQLSQIMLQQLPGLIFIPLALAIITLFSYPFLGDDGSARFMAFAIMGLLPMLILINIFAEHTPIWLVFGWLALIWCIAAWHKIDDQKKAQQLHAPDAPLSGSKSEDNSKAARR